MSSSSVMQGDAECGESGMTLGEGAGLLTMCKLTEGLWGKPEIGETAGGGSGGGRGGGGGGGGGVVFFRSGDEDKEEEEAVPPKDIALFIDRPLVPPPLPLPPLLPTSFGVEKSNSISAASCELVPPPDDGGGRAVRVTLPDGVLLGSTCVRI